MPAIRKLKFRTQIHRSDQTEKPHLPRDEVRTAFKRAACFWAAASRDEVRSCKSGAGFAGGSGGTTSSLRELWADGLAFRTSLEEVASVSLVSGVQG